MNSFFGQNGMPIKSIPDSLHKMKVHRYSVIGPDNLPSIINIIDLQMNSAEKSKSEGLIQNPRESGSHSPSLL